MKQLYIFNQKSVGSNYGIKTYIDMLIDSLKNTECFSLNIVELGTKSALEMTIEEKEHIKYFCIPGYSNKYTNDRYCRNVVYLLMLHIANNANNEIVFHLNYMNNLCLSNALKRFYPDSKIMLTVHYTEWSFQFLGNIERFMKVLKTENHNELTEEERYAKLNYENERKLLNNCDEIIAIASHSFNILCAVYQINPSKITIIHHTLKDEYRKYTAKEKLQIRKQIHIKKAEKVLLFVGRLNEVKGVHVLIKAFNQLLDRFSNLRLLIVGDGDFQECFSRIDNIHAKITFTGFLEKEKIYQLYSIADIGIVPSFYEEFGYVTLEMMMHKLPIIANNTSGIAEMITNEIDGLLVNMDSGEANMDLNIQQLVNAMVYLLINKNMHRKLGNNARKKYVVDYQRNMFVKHIYTAD